ncbi:oligoribonuclease [Trypanosoma cruzi]|nr:oligoribonuclease [Trypanosoma cruzi]
MYALCLITHPTDLNKTKHLDTDTYKRKGVYSLSSLLASTDNLTAAAIKAAKRHQRFSCQSSRHSRHFFSSRSPSVNCGLPTVSSVTARSSAAQSQALGAIAADVAAVLATGRSRACGGGRHSPPAEGRCKGAGGSTSASNTDAVLLAKSQTPRCRSSSGVSRNKAQEPADHSLSFDVWKPCVSRGADVLVAFVVLFCGFFFVSLRGFAFL